MSKETFDDWWVSSLPRYLRLKYAIVVCASCALWPGIDIATEVLADHPVSRCT